MRADPSPFGDKLSAGKPLADTLPDEPFEPIGANGPSSVMGLGMQAHTLIYLASQSPRRRQLLDQIGVRHELLLAAADEETEALEQVRQGELPCDYVTRVTRAKLDAARQRLAARGLPRAPILCADTTVAIGRRILGKPANGNEARFMLEALSGRTHRVLSAVAIGTTGAQRIEALGVSRVRFAVLPANVIDAYIASGEPFGKAGAYAIQGALAAWIEHIEGSYSGVMGLPLAQTAALLRRARVVHALDGRMRRIADRPAAVGAAADLGTRTRRSGASAKRR